MLDIGYSIQDTGCMMQDTGYQMLVEDPVFKRGYSMLEWATIRRHMSLNP